jgi:hypothetical protein
MAHEHGLTALEGFPLRPARLAQPWLCAYCVPKSNLSDLSHASF